MVAKCGTVGGEALLEKRLRGGLESDQGEVAYSLASDMWPIVRSVIGGLLSGQ